MTKPVIAIIGPGKVGQAMARMLNQCGYTIAAMGGRDQTRIQEAVSQLTPSPQALSISEASLLADTVLITVKDDAIEDVVNRCAFRTGATVIHMSGTHSSHVLDAAKQKFACSIASFHALQTFASVEQAMSVLPGCSSFIEGDDPASRIAEQMATDLGMHPVRFSSTGKPFYHSAAVMACNYLTALTDAVFETANAAGITRTELQQAFMPLISSTLENIYTSGTQQALTGPIDRGDVNTVATHLEALSGLPEIQEVYRALGRYTTHLAERKQSISPEKACNLRKTLAPDTPTRRLPIVGVMGSGTRSSEPLATELGHWLATQPVNLLTGGGQGNMNAVCKAFSDVPDRRGRIIGILPGQITNNQLQTPAGYPNHWIEIPIYTHLPGRGTDGKDETSRNHINILSSDVIIALPGSHGTRSEVELALNYNRPVIVYAPSRTSIPQLPQEVPCTDQLDDIKAFLNNHLPR